MSARTEPQLAAETITVEELLRRIDEARSKMGDSNANKALFLQCRTAIAYLASIAPDELLVEPAKDEPPVAVPEGQL